jgi:hypothetical protein
VRRAPVSDSCVRMVVNDKGGMGMVPFVTITRRNGDRS